MKYLYATAAVVVIACGATYLINDAAQKRTAKEEACKKHDLHVGATRLMEGIGAEYAKAIRECADRW